MIWLLCTSGMMVIVVIVLFWLILRDGSKLGTRITALEDPTEIDVLKERVALLERERDVRNLRSVIARATGHGDEGRPI